MIKWSPIDTVPKEYKDGREILVRSPMPCGFKRKWDWYIVHWVQNDQSYGTGWLWCAGDRDFIIDDATHYTLLD